MSRYGRNMTVKGLDQLIQHLEHLPDEIRGKVGRAATARAADFCWRNHQKHLRTAQPYRVTFTWHNHRAAQAISPRLIIKKYASPKPSANRNAASPHKITFKLPSADVHGIGTYPLLEYGTSPHEITLKNGNTWQHPGTGWPLLSQLLKPIKAN